MKIIEQFTLGKSGNIADSEDKTIITEHFVAVIDGTTSKSNLNFGGITPGKLAGTLIESVFTFLPEKITAEEMIHLLNQQFHEYYNKTGISKEMEEHPWDRPSASIAVYSKYHQEIWMAGDCQALVNNLHHTHTKEIDRITSETRALYLEMEIASGKTIQDLQLHDTGRNYILPLLKNQALFQNPKEEKLFAFEVIDGFTQNLNKVKKIKIKEGEIVLATDGYPKLFSTLQESEKYLDYILKTDPLLFRKYKSTKGLIPGNISFDDRTYVRIQP